MVAEIDEPARGNTAGDGVRYGACGILGGKDGLPHRYVLHSDGRQQRVLKTKEVGIEIRPGDVFQIESGGGGGWGDPAKRDPAARQSDEINGFVEARASSCRLLPSLRDGRGRGMPARLPCEGAWDRCTHAEDRHRRRRHVHRPGRGGRQRPLHTGQGGLHARRPVDRRDGRPRPAGRTAAPAAPPNCSRRPSASCTAPPSPPTRCSSARAPRSGC